MHHMVVLTDVEKPIPFEVTFFQVAPRPSWLGLVRMPRSFSMRSTRASRAMSLKTSAGRQSAESVEDWVVVSKTFYVHPYLEKISNLTNIFQMGWNHQLEELKTTTKLNIGNLSILHWSKHVYDWVYMCVICMYVEQTYIYMYIYIHSQWTHTYKPPRTYVQKSKGCFFFFFRRKLGFEILLEKLRIDSYLRPESYLGELGVDENLMSEEFWHTLREALRAQFWTCINSAKHKVRIMVDPKMNWDGHKIVQADSSKDSADVLQFLAGTHCGGSRGDRPRLEPEGKQHSQGRQHHSSSARQVSWPPNRVYNGRNGSCTLLRCVLPISLFALLLFFFRQGRLTLSWKRSCNAWRLKSEQLWTLRRSGRTRHSKIA